MVTLTRRAGIATTAAVACWALSAPEAHAAKAEQPPHTAGYDVTPSECLSDDGRGGEYFDSTVASASVSAWSESYLYCRYPGRGMWHISERHHIDPEGYDDNNFVRCIMNFSDYGYDAPSNQPEKNYAMEMKYGNGQVARLAYDKNTYEMVSAHTSGGPSGNDWSACATTPSG